MAEHREIAKIESTHLGTEDHGILTAMLHVSYGGSSQGVGGYPLDGPSDGRPGRRLGSAFGMEFVRRTLRACGVDRWEQLVGRTIYVVQESGRVIGIENLPTEPGERFIFQDLVAEFREEVPA